MKPNTRPKLVFVLSDLHCGSTVGLLPPDFVTGEEQTVKQNAAQKWLWSCWLDSLKWAETLAGKDPYAVVVNGDLIEGNHHRTTQIISPDVSDHIKASIECLAPITKKSARTFIVKGTECHTGSAEAGIVKALGLPDPAVDRLNLDVNGVRCVFRHHIGTSTRRALAATQLSIQLSEEQVEAANNGDVLPRVLGCAHRHKFGYYEDNHGLCFVTPPWQALTRFGHSGQPSPNKPGASGARLPRQGPRPTTSTPQYRIHPREPASHHLMKPHTTVKKAADGWDELLLLPAKPATGFPENSKTMEEISEDRRKVGLPYGRSQTYAWIKTMTESGALSCTEGFILKSGRLIRCIKYAPVKKK